MPIKRNGHNGIEQYYPLITKESLKQFEFFTKNNKGSFEPFFTREKDKLYALASDICAFVRLFRQTPELIEFVVNCRLLLHNNDTRRSDFITVTLLLERMKGLDSFFEFHQERGYPIKDQRVDLLLDLRSDVKIMIRFLRKRAKK